MQVTSEPLTWHRTSPPIIVSVSLALLLASANGVRADTTTEAAGDDELAAGSDTEQDAEQETGPDDVWTDARIDAAIRAGCDRRHALRTYRGTPSTRFDDLGPLWLAERDDERARGVVLPTFLRLFLYGRHRVCQRIDLDEARTLAGPETWVVLWRTEDPYRGRSKMTSSDQRVLRPTEVRLRHDDAWHPALETRDTDRWIRTWFGDDWNEDESLLAVFEEVPRTTSLFVDYAVEEGGRSYLTDSSIFSLSSVPMKWWAIVHGEPVPEGGPWWKR